MRSTMPIIKWVAPLTKLYPVTNSLMVHREHPTFRHPPKIQTLREYIDFRENVWNKKLTEASFWEGKLGRQGMIPT
jgi:hypothetical protein